MKVKVLFHDACFDGAVSAAVFSRFFSECISKEATFTYQGLSHKSGGGIEENLLDGDVNAVVDFRYSSSKKLHWWFDHHASAFPSEKDREHFNSDKTGKKFYDPVAKSCAGFLCRIAKEQFRFDGRDLAELVHWADIIDGALFPDAQTAVRLEHPALKLMLVLEANPGAALIPKIIEDIQCKDFQTILEAPYVAQALKPLFQKHLASIELVRSRAALNNGVVFVNLADKEIDSLNKFIAYDLFPEAVYSVVVLRYPQRSKISVGSNPWKREQRTHDLSKICERYGGGGHPAVGAISYPTAEIQRALQTAQEIVQILQTG